jgi:hypothetical protein
MFWPFRASPPPPPAPRKFYVTYHVAAAAGGLAIGSKVVTFTGPLNEAVLDQLTKLVDAEPAITVPRPRVVLLTAIIPLEG